MGSESGREGCGDYKARTAPLSPAQENRGLLAFPRSRTCRRDDDFGDHDNEVTPQTLLGVLAHFLPTPSLPWDLRRGGDRGRWSSQRAGTFASVVFGKANPTGSLHVRGVGEGRMAPSLEPAPTEPRGSEAAPQRVRAPSLQPLPARALMTRSCVTFFMSCEACLRMGPHRRRGALGSLPGTVLTKR